MVQLTERMAGARGAERRPGVSVKNDVEDLGEVVDLTREQQRRAATVVLNHLGDSDDARAVVAMLCQPVRAVTAVHSEQRDHETVMRREYLNKVRQWAIENDVPLGKSGYVTRTAQAAYSRAQAGGEP